MQNCGVSYLTKNQRLKANDDFLKYANKTQITENPGAFKFQTCNFRILLLIHVLGKQ